MDRIYEHVITFIHSNKNTKSRLRIGRVREQKHILEFEGREKQGHLVTILKVGGINHLSLNSPQSKRVSHFGMK